MTTSRTRARSRRFLERRDATNLESALKLAQASFPEDTAKRIVIVTDGNENLGDAASVAPSLASNGIGIDVVPVKLTTRAEVAVEKITIPADIRRGTPFEVRTVLNNFMEATHRQVRPDTVRGRLRLTRTFGGREELIGEDQVELPPGKTVIGFRHRIDKPAMYTYQARLRSRRPARRLDAAEQSGVRLHPRARQGTRAVDRRL